jgi:hypothetical protein
VRKLLAVFWTNEFTTNGFDTAFGADAIYAKETVSRAVDDWNRIISDQNFDNDDDAGTNNFQLTLDVLDLVTINTPTGP